MDQDNSPAYERYLVDTTSLHNYNHMCMVFLICQYRRELPSSTQSLDIDCGEESYERAIKAQTRPTQRNTRQKNKKKEDEEKRSRPIKVAELKIYNSNAY